MKKTDDVEVLKDRIEVLKKKNEKNNETFKVLENIIEKKDKTIAKLEQEKEEWFAIEKNGSAYADVKQFERLEKRVKDLEELLEKKEKKIIELNEHKDKLIDCINSNTVNVDKATRARVQNKVDRREKYIVELKKLVAEKPDVKVKEIIEALGISKMTYYNLELDKV